MANKLSTSTPLILLAIFRGYKKRELYDMESESRVDAVLKQLSRNGYIVKETEDDEYVCTSIGDNTCVTIVELFKT